MELENLTIRILQEIRDETRGTREEVSKLTERMDARFERMDARFELVETTLRDLAQQLVVLARGVKSLIDVRTPSADRMDDYGRRIEALEKRVGT